MFTAFIYTNVQVTFDQTNFLDHILNRQPATESATSSWIGIWSEIALQTHKNYYWALVFFLDLNAMFTAFIYTYDQVTFVQTNVLYHSPNRQLNRQPATESATGSWIGNW